MKYVVSSSLIEMIEVLPKKGVIVTFVNGERYKYPDLPTKTAEAMARAESVGKYFNKYVREQYDSEKL